MPGPLVKDVGSFYSLPQNTMDGFLMNSDHNLLKLKPLRDIWTVFKKDGTL